MSTILGNLRQLFRDICGRNRADQPGNPTEMNALFRFRYTLFKELLVANSELLTVLSDMDEKLKGETIFGLSYITNQVNKSLRHAFQMVKSLNVMSGGKHRELYAALERINDVRAFLWVRSGGAHRGGPGCCLAKREVTILFHT